MDIKEKLNQAIENAFEEGDYNKAAILIQSHAALIQAQAAEDIAGSVKTVLDVVREAGKQMAAMDPAMLEKMMKR